MGDRIARGAAVRFLMVGTLAAALPSAVSLAPAQTQTQTQTPAAESEDIVVIGRKIRKVRLNYALWGSHMKRCGVEISSGDEHIDRFVCAVLNACIKDGFRDAVSAKACLDERIASVAYRPPRWPPAANEPGDIAPSSPVALPSPIVPAEPADTEIVVAVGRPHVTPGLWRINQSSTFSETPGPKFQPLPGRVYTVCIAYESRDTALEKLLSAVIDPSTDGFCTMSNIRVKNGKVTGGKTCSFNNGNLGYDLHGKVNGETMDTALSIISESGSTKTRYRRRITGARIGDCPA
jgi:hypothetical protein